MRKMSIEIAPTGNISISGSSGLDITYGELFKSAANEIQQGKATIDLGLTLIIFGCFWLEARCNEVLKELLERSTELSTAGTVLWENAVERASFHSKFGIVSAFAKGRNEDRIKALASKMRQVFELRNRLAHFKDKHVLLADDIDVHELDQFLESVPEAELITLLKPPAVLTYRTMISDGIDWLNEIKKQYFPMETPDAQS